LTCGGSTVSHESYTCVKYTTDKSEITVMVFKGEEQERIYITNRAEQG